MDKIRDTAKQDIKVITTKTDDIQKQRLADIKHSQERDVYLAKLRKDINLSDPDSINNFGEKIQKSSNDFSTRVLETVKSKDLGDVGEDMKNLVKTIQMNDTKKLFPLTKDGTLAKPSFFSRIFQKAIESTFEVKVRMTHVETQIESVAATLKQKSTERVSDNKQLEGMHDRNLDIALQLTDYIDAGTLEINKYQSEDIPALTDRIKKLPPSSPEYQSLANDLQDMKDNVERLDHRVHDLFLNRQLLMQSGPQIRMLQKANNELVEQTNALLSIAIPAWKNQAALTIQILKSAEQAQLDAQVRQVTNASIIKSAKLLNHASVQIAQQSSQSVIAVEALKTSQDELLDSIDKIAEIQKTAAQTRIDEKKAVEQMAQEMRKRLLAHVSDSTMRDVTPKAEEITYDKDFEAYNK